MAQRISGFFRCECGKLHARTTTITITTVCTCGRRLHERLWR